MESKSVWKTVRLAGLKKYWTEFTEKEAVKEIHCMALTKIDVIKIISEKMELDKKTATETLEQLMAIIKSTLASGEDVLISGFGKFCVVQKNVRKGRNPATGEDMMLDARNRINFKCSGKLRDQINGKKG